MEILQISESAIAAFKVVAGFWMAVHNLHDGEAMAIWLRLIASYYANPQTKLTEYGQTLGKRGAYMAFCADIWDNQFDSDGNPKEPLTDETASAFLDSKEPDERVRGEVASLLKKLDS